jgi:tetratricopeptide (TPR) repeat protein
MMAAMRLPALLVLVLLPSLTAAAPPDPMEDPAAIEAVRLQATGRYDLSVPLLESVLARLPGDPDVLTYLALALRSSGRHAEAEARYDQALARDQRHLPAIAYQGVLFLETGRRDRAEANLRRLEALCPTGCPARDELAREVAARR